MWYDIIPIVFKFRIKENRKPQKSFIQSSFLSFINVNSNHNTTTSFIKIRIGCSPFCRISYPAFSSHTPTSTHIAFKSNFSSFAKSWKLKNCSAKIDSFHGCRARNEFSQVRYKELEGAGPSSRLQQKKKIYLCPPIQISNKLSEHPRITKFRPSRIGEKLKSNNFHNHSAIKLLKCYLFLHGKMMLLLLKKRFPPKKNLNWKSSKEISMKWKKIFFPCNRYVWRIFYEERI